jgi:hypothetical protein
LDAKLVGGAMARLHKEAGDANEWLVYHFLSNPCGDLNGLRPFECLISRKTLTPTSWAARAELKTYLQLPASASLERFVRRLLREELDEAAG